MAKKQTSTSPTKPELDAADDKYLIAKSAAEYILQKGEHTNPDSTVATSDLYQRASVEFPEAFADFKESTFGVYLSRAGGDTSTQINTLGRRKGYYLTRNVAARLLEDEPADEEEEKLKRRESLLYSVVQNWLMELGYRAKDVSNQKAGGAWGNPDLCGINLMKRVGGHDIEITTVEVKPSLANWERQFFEAVSHRRFANRSYFAFAHPRDEISKVPSDMRYYSELFGVGVLVLAMEFDDFDDLQSKKPGKPFGVDEIDVREVYSAPFSAVQPAHTARFLSNLELYDIEDIAGFGARLDQ